MNAIDEMRWASALSERPAALQALHEVLDAIDAQLGAAPDLAFLFLSVHHLGSLRAIAEAFAARHPGCRLFGASAVGVIGAGREIERREALSVTCARLPGVRIGALHCAPGERVNPDRIRERLGLEPQDQPHFLVLADPADLTLGPLLETLDRDYPAATKLGGLVSGSDPGEGILFCEGNPHRGGTTLVALSGNLSVQGLVAQGCRPVGQPMIVTRCRDNIIDRLNVGTPVEALRALVDSLDARDQALCRHALHLGLEMRAEAHEYRQGDFLIREILGMDPNSGAMAVSAPIHDYQVVQFHLRDGQSAARDLQIQLARLEASTVASLRGALLFSCAGRGRAMFDASDHDSDAFARRAGAVPLGGFFGSGEIGRVQGVTFVHGYTSVFALFGVP